MSAAFLPRRVAVDLSFGLFTLVELRSLDHHHQGLGGREGGRVGVTAEGDWSLPSSLPLYHPTAVNRAFTLDKCLY